MSKSFQIYPKCEKKNKNFYETLREGPSEDHPTLIGPRRRKFFFSILLHKMIDFD
jgi:hypothetical protein